MTSAPMPPTSIPVTMAVLRFPADDHHKAEAQNGQRVAANRLIDGPVRPQRIFASPATPDQGGATRGTAFTPIRSPGPP
jgi:hypothetical protein